MSQKFNGYLKFKYFNGYKKFEQVYSCGKAFCVTQEENFQEIN